MRKNLVQISIATLVYFIFLLVLSQFSFTGPSIMMMRIIGEMTAVPMLLVVICNFIFSLLQTIKKRDYFFILMINSLTITMLILYSFVQ